MQARLVSGRGGWIRLGCATTPERARAAAQAVRRRRPAGSSDWVEVHEVAYERDDPETGAPLPPGVVGYPVGGRR